jgi:hypothetical protein
MASYINEICIAAGFVAGAMHLAAYAIYFRSAKQGSITPNAATWTIWGLVSILNMATYFAIARDWVLVIMPMMSSLVCTGVWIVLLWQKKLHKLNRTDEMTLSVAILAIVFWIAFRSAAGANVILQIAESISFVPAIGDVRRDPKAEKPLPWFLWGGAYGLLTAVVALRFDGQWVQFVYPVNLLVLHLAVGALSLRRPRLARA